MGMVCFGFVVVVGNVGVRSVVVVVVVLRRSCVGIVMGFLC